MRVFITGATGFIGMNVVKDLVAAGHKPIGLCRAPEKAAALAAAGAEVVEGTVQDEAKLKDGAAKADAVIHLAFNHDFSQFVANCQDDRRVIGVLGAALAGSDRPLVVTSGTAIAKSAPGQPARETDPCMPAALNPRAASEEAARPFAEKGVKVSIMRLSQIHDTRRQGLVTPAIELFQQKGACAYIGEGANRWAAAHISDVAPLYRLAVEKGERDAIYNAVGEEGVSMRDIAETLGKRLDLPVRSLGPDEIDAFFGWLGMFAHHDMPASSEITQGRLGWTPKGPGFLADLARLELD
jgi:nucleoside-diphosphate-sugar epimerase